MLKWISIFVFLVAIVVMYLVLGTDVFKAGEEEEKLMQHQIQQENTLINEVEDSQ